MVPAGSDLENCFTAQVPLEAVLPFLDGSLRGAGEQRRNASVVKSLRRSENLQCREAAIQCRQRCVHTLHQSWDV